jgi:predicted 3-demethylubiquinone-9 3-methyltransferase (glyoxalase superfamily)
VQKIVPFLWFDGAAEEAMNFYVALFPNSSAGAVTRWGDGGPGPKGSVMSVKFRLDGQEFIGLNGGPMYKFSPAISFFVNCETQTEVDDLYEKLSAGGEKQPCGWLKDKFGVSWQVIPAGLFNLLQDKDPQRAKRATQAMLSMRKIDIGAMRKAADGPG